ncbi:uncharacterized protein LOC126992253 [Eriocheir sinensis]|uniref:uncharacterized protein LOC126992253 n=1 Tax=Eriocheir sinensis TaxID=95602 RepID=UPI0021C9714E|nr:uncharacterized protein LOC126992253 [Eriocheir sinensis]XP_050706874.1 uncharacterized protein LOC126992253 [Eriocheir sinensis]
MNGRGEKCLKLALAKKSPGIGLEQVSNDADTGSVHERASDSLQRQSTNMEEDSHTSLEGEPSASKARLNLVSNEHFTTSDLDGSYYDNSNVQLPKDTTCDDESNSSSSESSSSSSESSSSSSESSSSSSALVDSDDSVKDKDYVPESQLLGTTEKDQSNDSDEYSGDQCGNEGILNSPVKKKGFKRKRNPQTWYRNAQKKLRNEGKAYKMASKYHREKPARTMKPPCTEKCRLKCFSTFSNEERERIFNDYWQLGSLEKQRLFILNCMEQIQPSYRYIRVGGNRPPRKLNNAFSFNVDGEKKSLQSIFQKYFRYQRQAYSHSTREKGKSGRSPYGA